MDDADRALVPFGPPGTDPTGEVRVVRTDVVVRILDGLGGALPWRSTFPEVAAAIARAATDDPILPDRADGAELTASLLVAASWEASRFEPHDNAYGRVGLYRIRPPPFPTMPNQLVMPRSASLVAIDLMRTSFDACVSMPWADRLAWYYDLGTDHKAPSRSALARSRRVLDHARRIFLRCFPPRAVPDESRPALDDGSVVGESESAA